MKYGDLFDHLNEKVNFQESDDPKVGFTWTCDGELTATKAFCKAHELDFDAVKERLGETGGYCDCEVLLNSTETIDVDEEMPSL